MPGWLVFLLGTWVGGAFGFMFAAILAAGSRADEVAGMDGGSDGPSAA